MRSYTVRPNKNQRTMWPIIPRARLTYWDAVTFWIAAFLIIGVAAMAAPASAAERFDIMETTIARTQQAIREHRVTCRQIVDEYLDRIRTYDQSTRLNALVVLNPNAPAEADRFDAEFKLRQKIAGLQCIAVIVKDNYDTKDLQTTGGSLAMKGFVPSTDAFMVRRLRDAGAILLAKSNMAEWAFSPYETVSSIAGITRNPYDLQVVPAGSSGGTAAAVAANFGLVGLGTDTGNSIRGPSSHNALVGIRSTMGWTSRAGVIPLSYLADVAGPMARTVEDAVAVFQVIIGEDPDDPMTARSRGRASPNFARSLVRDGLRGARIGILRQAYERGTPDPEILGVFAKAVADLKAAGATIVDGVSVGQVQRAQAVGSCRGFKYDINVYLAARGQRAPVHSLDEIIASGKFHPSIQSRLTSAQQANPQGPESDACKADADFRAAFGAAVTKTMNELTLD